MDPALCDASITQCGKQQKWDSKCVSYVQKWPSPFYIKARPEFFLIFRADSKWAELLDPN